MWGHRVPRDASHPEIHGRNEDSDLSQGPQPGRDRGHPTEVLPPCPRAKKLFSPRQLCKSLWALCCQQGDGDKRRRAGDIHERGQALLTLRALHLHSGELGMGPSKCGDWLGQKDCQEDTRTSEGHWWFLTAGLFIIFHPQTSAYKGLITNYDEWQVTPHLSCVPSTLTPQSTLRNLEQLQRRLMTRKHPCVCSGSLFILQERTMTRGSMMAKYTGLQPGHLSHLPIERPSGLSHKGPRPCLPRSSLWCHRMNYRSTRPRRAERGHWRRIWEASRDELVEVTQVKTGGWRLCDKMVVWF